MSCSNIYTVPVPGPQGPAGDDGTDGTNGVSAFTTTTAAFVMPVEGANVMVSVVTSVPFGIGQILYLEAGGAVAYMQVVSKPTATSLSLQNIENTGSASYTINSTPGTIFASSATVTPAGLQGAPGSATVGAPTTASYITQVPEAGLTGEQSLSALSTGLLKNTTTTGVLSIAVNGTDFYGPGFTVPLTDGGTGGTDAATARTSLGLAIGTNVQAYDATLQSLSALGTAANRYAYTTGVDTWAEGTLTAYAQNLLMLATPAQWRTALDTSDGYSILAAKLSLDCNTAGDTAITIYASDYIITEIIVKNASISLTTASLGVFTATGGGGTVIAADAPLSALTASDKWIALPLGSAPGTNSFTTATLYLRIGTPQGAAATCDVFIFGRKFN